ncbi:hypothetical protein HO133_006527 [Letharia lupina]|uniref:Protein kinase domain-containing protein n=1 Tax=Letharia lupina TaxID=560253 RepID=A0A8H6F6W0_9LECA|nr:uncharacterized protein HO133_006527 [Letharia lupina]KAF6217700.1 hypothetical protein HO133_006527 [Letharia lupina]
MTEITNTEQLKAYLGKLGNAKIDLTSLQLLAGGTANFVWRLLERSGKRIIIKHAEPYLKTAPGLSFSVDRMDFEHRAMTSVPPLLSPSSVVAVPEVYQYDSLSHVLMIEDGGARTLKEAYADPTLDTPTFGKALGRWLAGLHQRTKHTAIGDNQAAKSMYRFAYTHLAVALQKYDQDPSLAEQIDAQYGSLLQTDDECVCHGDFWPGNVLINDQGRLSIVDWEMVRRGCGATDVGQFAAEAHLLDRFRGGKGLRTTFLEGYRWTGELDNRFLKRVAIHMGVHLAFWPTRVSWGTETETKEIVKVGCELMKRALGQDESWLAGSLLNELQA